MYLSEIRASQHQEESLQRFVDELALNHTEKKWRNKVKQPLF
jgi:hypothetical protein